MKRIVALSINGAVVTVGQQSGCIVIEVMPGRASKSNAKVQAGKKGGLASAARRAALVSAQPGGKGRAP